MNACVWNPICPPTIPIPNTSSAVSLSLRDNQFGGHSEHAVRLELFAAAIPSAGAAASIDRLSSIDRLYVFGDSYSDIGAGYVDGDGPTAVAYLAQRLALSMVPPTADNANENSVNFAVRGAGTDSGSEHAGRELRHLIDAAVRIRRSQSARK